jgi:translation initiation factor 3 subunit D
MNNAFGWGPLLGEVPAIPYAPFSRTDRLGKIADFTEPTDDQPRVRSRPREAFGYSSASAFTYAAPDDTSFSVVDRVSVQRKNVTQKRPRGKGFTVQRRNDTNRKGGFYNRKRMEKPRLRDTSIKVGTSWTIVDEVEFARLSKLSYEVEEPRDVAFTGTLMYYEKTFDRVNTRNEKNLPQLEAGMAHFPTTSEDSVIQEVIL